MRIRGAVLEAKGGPFVLEDLDLDEPRPDEILVRIVASGICQTDAHARNQEMPVPMPIVLGHEGAGVVERCGSAVTSLVPGDHVVLSYQACGHCRPCLSGHPQYCLRGFDANFGGARLDATNGLHRAAPAKTEMHGHFFGQSSFATYALATERNAARIPKDVPLALMAPLGCGLQTGAGAVLNSLQVAAGSSIAIFGTGAVGLAAVMAARVAGAATIIAVDVNAQRLALATELGATHIINAREQDVPSQIGKIVPGGVNYILEITGRPEMLAMAVDCVAHMGTVGLIGGAGPGTKAPIEMLSLAWGRHLRGIVQGDAIPQLFIPTLIELHRSGKFPFERLVRFYEFEDIDQAFADSRSGEVIKPILRISKESS
jgi:aryl-alcohol dehydrogenase